jgi:hypothetical protein
MDHLVVTVHETKPVPQYQMLYGIYPAEVSLFYVDIEANKGKVPIEFRPQKYVIRDPDKNSEATEFPSPMVLDDDVPAQIALRINAKTRGHYLISADVVVSSADDREVLTIMPPQWVIFERDDQTDEG